MATPAVLIAELLEEAGLNPSSPVRLAFQTAVGDVTVDLLSQSQGKFAGLKKSMEFTLTSADRKVKLPADFNSAAELYEVDADGKFLYWGYVRDRSDVFENMATEGYVGHRQGWIEELSGADAPDGRGLYLVMGDLPDETVYFVFDYYRKATPEDTDLIKNPSIVKDGVRARFPKNFPDAQMYVVKYDREKQGFREDRHKRRTVSIFRPSRRVERHNRKMYRYGKGR